VIAAYAYASALGGRRLVCTILALSAALLAGCGESEDAKDAREGLQIAYDVMRGPPSEATLMELATFSDGGVLFSYPRPLHQSRELVGNDDVWSFRYGLYKAELWVAEEPQDALAYVDAIARALLATQDASVLEPVAQGRVLTICGQERETATVHIRFMDATSRYEAVVLPPMGDPRSRMLLFTDMRQDSREGWSRLADVATQTVLSTMRCRSSRAQHNERETT